MTQRRNQDYARTLPHPLPAEVVRTALHERIARADNASLIALVAPSGYGKTTLLGQIARASNHAAWLTLSDRHADLKSLTDALMTSITQAVKEATFGRVRKAVAEGAQVAALATLFARELDELAVNITILVDQTHLLGDDALSWLELFALALGEGHQLIYCAYDLASERLAAPLASGSALLFTASDLAFSEDESRAYLDARGSSADAFEVHRELEGWPAGVGLAAAGVGHVLSHDELLRAAFDRLPEDVREALPEASVLEVWREADAVQLGCALPKGWLRKAQRAGLPMTPLSTKVYKPHTLILEVLNEKLQAKPERYLELHSRAGHLAEEREDLILALKNFQKAEQTHDALRVAEVLIPRLRRRNENQLICDLAAYIREADMSPSLLANYGYALIQTDQVNYGETLLNKLWEQRLGGSVVPNSLGILAGRRGNPEQMLALAEESLHQTDNEEARTSPLRLKAAALTNLERHSEALSLTRELIAFLETSANRVELALAYEQLGRVYFDTERYLECEIAVRQALTIFEDLHLSHTISALGLTNELADVLRVQNRLSEARGVLERALPIAEQYKLTDRATLLDSLADILMGQTEFERAAKGYKEAIILYQKYKYDLAAQIARYKLFDAVRSSGDYMLAHRLLAEAHANTVVEQHIYFNGLPEFYDALDAFNRKTFKSAQEGFTAALSLTFDLELKIRACAYLLELSRQEGALTETSVGELTIMLDKVGHDATLWIDAGHLKPLYKECLARGWFGERFAPFTGPRSTLDVHKHALPLLHVQTLKDVRVTFDEKLVKLPFAKVTELLVWLVLKGPATRERIINALWNGSSDPKHIEYGKLALRRLRIALAEHVPFNPLVYANRQYQLADKLEVKLDVRDVLEAFEAGDDTARRAALERYDGTFLPGVTSEWVELMRVELHDMALATAMGLGASHERNDIALALWAYRKAIDLEPLFLDGYRVLVQLLQASGDQVGARLAYQTYLRVLTIEYGETPNLSFDDLIHKTQNKHVN